METEKLSTFQKKINYSFRDTELLKNALTHSSYANEKNWEYSANNERLEFLGDAVLETVASQYIFTENPDMVEGKMTKLRASLVCEMSLASSAREIGLGEYLYLGKGERHTGGAGRDSILSDAFEALIGAIFLDGGLEPAAGFICAFVLSDIEQKQLFYDSKTILQEIVQGKKHEEAQISYPLIKEEGPDHDKHFTVCCEINGQRYAEGAGHTKKAAQQQAAYQTILMLRKK